MKKLLVCVAALGMLFTSCMRDETRLDEGSIVTFKISAPAVSTRAAIEDTYGTGVAADDLHWAIFEADENGAAVGTAIFEHVEEGFFADGALENTFNVRLVKGKSYVGMFWAQANGAPYTVAWPEVTMGDVNSNDEDLDAFFNIHNFSITAGQDTGEQKVELRRPFAQLNVAIPATDLAAAKAAGFELAKTGVTLNVAKSLNLVTGKVGTAEDVTYTLANIPSDVTATLEGTEYQLVSFNYVLVDGDAWTTESDEGQELKDVTFNYGTADETLSQTFSNIAIERNHRTYIVGSLLSETVDFRVIILPDWENPYYLHNQEAGSITMVAEQTAINKAAMGSATLTWNAVEGAEYYGVEYKGEELDKVNPDSSIRTKADEAATTVSYTVPAGTVAEASASFTIKAYNNNDKVIARVVTDPITVFSLANRPEPAVYVADGELIVENKELNGTEAKKTNYHVNGVLLEAEVYFYKDGATTPTHTAKGTFWETYPNATYHTPAEALAATVNEKKFKNNFAGSYNTWFWDGATTATTTMPAFEKGTYTIKYKAGYYPVINASYDRTPTDRIIVTDPSDILQEMQYREGASDFKLVIAEGTTVTAVAKGYQGATVTWEAVDGAASYKVFVGETEKASTTELTADVTGLKDTNKYKFTVKALDASGNVMSAGVSEEITIWNVEGDLLPSPVIDMTQLAAGTLYLDATLDLTGVYKDITVKFTDANGNLAHKAYYSKYTSEGYNMDGQVTGNGENGGRFTYNFFGRYILPGATDGLWIWDDASEASVMPAFEPGEYTITYEATVWPIINAYWSVSGEYDATKYASKLEAAGGDASKIAEKARVHFAKSEYCLKEDIAKTGTFADKFVVDFTATATVGKAQYQAATVNWTPVSNATGFEVYVGANKVADAAAGATSVEVTGLTDDSIYEFTVKALGTSFEATTAQTSIFTFYHWTAPTFAFDGKRMIVSGLTNIDKAGGAGYAYGGAITNDNDTSKSTIEIYKDGTLLYTLTNGTGQGTLTAWAGYGRWALNAQENRKDWIWTKADGSALMAGETDVPEGSMPAGTYTLKWTIGYVVNKNANWATAQSDANIVSTKADALAALNDNGTTKGILWFGPKDVKPSPNVLYTSDAASAVKIFTKTGETTLTVE